MVTLIYIKNTVYPGTAIFETTPVRTTGTPYCAVAADSSSAGLYRKCLVQQYTTDFRCFCQHILLCVGYRDDLPSSKTTNCIQTTRTLLLLLCAHTRSTEHGTSTHMRTSTICTRTPYEHYFDVPVIGTYSAVNRDDL